MSFLTYRGEYDIKVTNMWIDGTVMNALVSHKLKKKKFVFDRTIIHKVGWRNWCDHHKDLGYMVNGEY